MQRSWVGPWLFALGALAGCGDDEGLELSVDLRTDFVAGVEFSGLRLELVGEGVSETDVAEPVSYVDGRRVFDLDGLAANERRVVALSLLDPMSAVLARREVIVDQSGDLAVTVVMTRDCASVSCPASAGDSATSCLGGRCVDPRCVEGDEEVCLDPQCETSSDCMPMNACAAPVCSRGVCLYAGLDACEAGTYCDPARGCVAIPGMDGGVAGPATPILFYPPQGANTGTVHQAKSGEVTFRWEANADPERFELQVDDSCPVGGYADCTFSSLESDVTIAGTQRSEIVTLPMATARPVGTRYTYRLRACNGAACSEWTRPRHLAVGRLGNDVDGDGYDELIIGARHLAHIVRGGSRTLDIADLPNPFPDATSGFGRSVAAADFDGDGYVDVAIGAPFDRGYGSVAIYRGSPTGLVPWVEVPGPDTIELNTAFGDDLCVGDFDGDGFGDVLTNTNRDGAFLIRGNGSGFEAPQSVSLAAGLLDCADVDFDGYTDVLAGSSYQRGGPGGITPTAVDPGSDVGHALGDLSGDGRPEYGSRGRGTFSILWSEAGSLIGTPTAVTGGLLTAEWAVRSIANDIDGDGIGDVAVSDPDASATDPGSAAIVFGSATPSGARYVELPGCGPCRQGWSLTSGLDIDGDGLADFAVGAPSGTLVDVFFGGSTEPPTSQRLTGGDGFGIGL